MPWLLVFDNADSKDKDILFEEFWPAGTSGSVLVTSRDTALASSFGGEILTGLAEESAVTLLLKLIKPQWQEASEERSSLEVQAALRIVAHVGYLPLAIIQAAKIIVNDSCLLSDFLDAYNDRELIEGSDMI